MDKNIVKTIVDAVIFLEFTDSSLLDEDASIKAMEQLASALQGADATTRLELSTQMAELSSTYSDPAIRAFVAGMPETLGLV